MKNIVLLKYEKLIIMASLVGLGFVVADYFIFKDHEVLRNPRITPYVKMARQVAINIDEGDIRKITDDGLTYITSFNQDSNFLTINVTGYQTDGRKDNNDVKKLTWRVSEDDVLMDVISTNSPKRTETFDFKESKEYWYAVRIPVKAALAHDLALFDATIPEEIREYKTLERLIDVGTEHQIPLKEFEGTSSKLLLEASLR